MATSAEPTGVLEVVTPASKWIKPVPQVDPISAAYFRAALDGRLLIERCPSCGRAQHYPRGICVTCGATPNWEDASGRGRVYSYSVVRQAGMPGYQDEVPYVVALIDLDEGPRLMGNVTDCNVDEVRIGAEVDAYVVRVSDDVGLVQWRLRPAST